MYVSFLRWVDLYFTFSILLFTVEDYFSTKITFWKVDVRNDIHLIFTDFLSDFSDSDSDDVLWLRYFTFAKPELKYNLREVTNCHHETFMFILNKHLQPGLLSFYLKLHSLHSTPPLRFSNINAFIMLALLICGIVNIYSEW